MQSSNDLPTVCFLDLFYFDKISREKWVNISVHVKLCSPQLNKLKSATMKDYLCSFKWLKFNLRRVSSLRSFGVIYYKNGVLFRSNKTEDYFFKFVY